MCTERYQGLSRRIKLSRGIKGTKSIKGIQYIFVKTFVENRMEQQINFIQTKNQKTKTKSL